MRSSVIAIVCHLFALHLVVATQTFSVVSNSTSNRYEDYSYNVPHRKKQHQRRRRRLSGKLLSAINNKNNGDNSNDCDLTSDDDDIRWLLLESPLKEELELILKARDDWWITKQQAVLDKKLEEWQKQSQEQIQALQQQVDTLQQQQQQPPKDNLDQTLSRLLSQQQQQQQQQHYHHHRQHGVLRPYGEPFDQAMDKVDPLVTTKSQVLQYQQDQQQQRRQQQQQQQQEPQPVIYVITPTVHRLTQMADLTRLGQTLLLDSFLLAASGDDSSSAGIIYWIVVEDATYCTRRLRNLLQRLGLPFAHWAIRSKSHTKSSNNNNKSSSSLQQQAQPPPKNKVPLPRGVDQRNRGLQLTKQIGIPGVVYFADDDNAYDVRLFDQLRQFLLSWRSSSDGGSAADAAAVGILPVGFRGGGHYERCRVDPGTGKVASIVEKTHTKRIFPMDMAGLVYHTSILWQKNPTFSNQWSNGLQEEMFLHQLIDNKDISRFQPLAYNCTHFFVWHLKSEQLTIPLKVWDDPEYDVLRNLV